MRFSLVHTSLFGLGLFLPSFAFAAIPDTPSNLEMLGGVYTNDTSPTLTWDAVPGAVHYDYRLNDGNYRGIGDETTVTLGGMRDGWHTFHLRAQDETGNSSRAASLTFEIDTQGPTVPALQPTSATVGTPVTLATTTSGEAWTMSCRLTIDGADAGEMHAQTQTFGKTYTFTTSGKHKAYATCVDGDGNTTVGNPTTVSVEASHEAGEGSLIKTADSSAVYYYGEDGKRHVFPNEQVYWSWYDDFDDVRTVTSASLDAIPLGTNVTLRPGSALVRFATENATYAVDAGARLRRYVSASLMMLEYGASWSSFLVTLPDVLRSNYATGAKIDESGDYDREKAWDSVSGVGDLFPW